MMIIVNGRECSNVLKRTNVKNKPKTDNDDNRTAINGCRL